MASFTPEKRYFAPSFSRLLQDGRCEDAVAYASSVVFTAEDLKDAVKRMMRLIPTNQTQLKVLQAAMGNYRDTMVVTTALRQAVEERARGL